MTSFHDDDFGNAIAALSILCELGMGDSVIYSSTRERKAPTYVNVIARLWEALHYVFSVYYAHHLLEEESNFGRAWYNYGHCQWIRGLQGSCASLPYRMQDDFLPDVSGSYQWPGRSALLLGLS